MAKSYFAKDADFTDYVKGKGRSLFILLHGSPGTEKPLTAGKSSTCLPNNARLMIARMCSRRRTKTAVHDLLRRPGTEPTKLEMNIRSVFEDATMLGAVLLLDEADIFLEEPDFCHLKGYALVSVFLQKLEFFDGVLFLAASRPELLYEAFQSRIHITMRVMIRVHTIGLEYG